MKNFDDINYERIDFEKIAKKLEELIKKLKKISDFNLYKSVVQEINSIQIHIEEMFDYADIRNMRDISDEYYKEEINYWNEFKPKFDLLFLPFYEEMHNSKFKNELLEVVPTNFFSVIEYQLRITSEEVTLLQIQENELKTKYRKLNGTKILFDGEEKTIGNISGLFSNKDRNIRKKAHDVINDFYYSHQNEYDTILFELVSVRNKIAKTLGFDNYSLYSLYKLKRFGYDYKDISVFRDNIIKFISPLCERLSNWREEELGLEKIEYYDTIFFEAMPQVKFYGETLLNEFKDSFSEVDSELFKMFDMMLDYGYIDLLQRNSKVNFSITNYLTESCVPVVTANYKNSYLDIQTTTHEVGHSFQKYCASVMDKDFIVSPLLKYPTMEIAEMFSYSMELIMMGHVQNLFEEEDYKKYCFMKIYDLVSSLPYICLVDEFQEKIYLETNLVKEDIRRIWLELVSKYHLERSNRGHINLDSGGYFYRQTHIYLDPFYYIDYALSYFGAFAIWNGCQENLDLFKEIGSVASYYSFKELVDKYNMPDPFDDDTVKDISYMLESQLERRRYMKIM